MLKHRLTHRSHSAERDDLPINFLIDNFEPRHACGRATVGSRHAAGIQKQNRSASFISRHVRVPVQHGIDISRRLRRRNMLETEFQSTANEIDNQRPFEVGVTISAHESDSWTDCAKFVRILSAQTSPRCQISSASLAIWLTFSGRRLCVSARTKICSALLACPAFFISSESLN
jgi:hypothetical protein